MRRMMPLILCGAIAVVMGCEDKQGATQGDVDQSLAAHASDPSAHHVKTTDASELTKGTLDSARLDAALTGAISTNTADIATNTADIAANGAAITTNATGITTNATDISTNAGDIATNAGNITTNASDIGTNATNLSTHAGNANAHHYNNITVLGYNSGSIDTTVTGTFEQLAIVGNFTKNLAGTTVRVTWYDHAWLEGAATQFCHFQLRVDDTSPPGFGSGTGAVVYSTGTLARETVHDEGLWTGLGTGTHEVSIWLRGSASTSCRINPGNFSRNAIVQEYN